MYQVCIFDCSIASPNIGDQIIMRSVNAHIGELLPDAFRINVPTHDYMGKSSRQIARHSQLRFVGGSNLLKTRMFWNAQWKLSLRDFIALTDVVIMGCGWRNYQAAPEPVTRVILRRLLSKRWLHSVRDEYTRKQLACAGVHNVLNTACPTMWQLTKAHCGKIPARATDTVVFTLTAYEKDPPRDLELINTLRQHYKHLFFFSQQPEDLDYLKELTTIPVSVLAPSLQAFEKFLQERHTDYVGTRLHGGIFALQHQRRALIIGIDNRAREIAGDTGLPVLMRDSLEDLVPWITAARPTLVRLPSAAIQAWKDQFSSPTVQMALPMNTTVRVQTARV